MLYDVILYYTILYYIISYYIIRIINCYPCFAVLPLYPFCVTVVLFRCPPPVLPSQPAQRLENHILSVSRAALRSP